MSATMVLDFPSRPLPRLVTPEGSPLTSFGHGAEWRHILQIWQGRIHLRKQLRRLLRDKPELIDDIGLTIEQAEAELTKHFWQRSCAG